MHTNILSVRSAPTYAIYVEMLETAFMGRQPVERGKQLSLDLLVSVRLRKVGQYIRICPNIGSACPFGSCIVVRYKL
jgi:hypothetical protein